MYYLYPAYRWYCVCKDGCGFEYFCKYVTISVYDVIISYITSFFRPHFSVILCIIIQLGMRASGVEFCQHQHDPGNMV